MGSLEGSESVVALTKASAVGYQAAALAAAAAAAVTVQ